MIFKQKKPLHATFFLSPLSISQLLTLLPLYRRAELFFSTSCWLFYSHFPFWESSLYTSTQRQPHYTHTPSNVFSHNFTWFSTFWEYLTSLKSTVRWWASEKICLPLKYFLILWLTSILWMLINAENNFMCV